MVEGRQLLMVLGGVSDPSGRTAYPNVRSELEPAHLPMSGKVSRHTMEPSSTEIPHDFSNQIRKWRAASEAHSACIFVPLSDNTLGPLSMT